MGIQVEFNPDPALRNISEFQGGDRLSDECIPENIEAGKNYNFLKEGLSNFWLFGEIPLIETDGNEVFADGKVYFNGWARAEQE